MLYCIYMTGLLSIVGTPIGNMADITLRALQTLRDADIILCEDTRVTKKLLFHYEITEKTLWAYDEHSHDEVFGKIVSALISGQKLALVSDAGMPCISDPGCYLVSQLRAHPGYGQDFTLDVIPGATALTSGLALSGIDTTDGFDFYGFAPHKKGRETLFRTIAGRCSEGRVCVFYESTHRILRALEQLQSADPTLDVTLARELTKMFEQCISGTPADLIEQLNKTTDWQKGEFVVIVK
jgi:16S rRNA (cytidine1402-2'-O)-methyltransferase